MKWFKKVIQFMSYFLEGTVGLKLKIKFIKMSKRLPREILAKARSKNKTPLFNLYAADTSH